MVPIATVFCENVEYSSGKHEDKAEDTQQGDADCEEKNIAKKGKTCKKHEVDRGETQLVFLNLVAMIAYHADDCNSVL